MNFSPSNEVRKTSTPKLLDESAYLIEKLRKLSPRQIGKMMSINPQLTDLNYVRYQQWNKEYENIESKAAILAFDGEVYRGLNAEEFDKSEIEYANSHLAILSGLHGVLRPLDCIQPYRLEMGSRFAVTNKQNNLYKFWGDKISLTLNEMISQHGNKTIINLASNEYWKAVQPALLIGRVIHCQFLDRKNGEYKSVMTWTKKARGMMAREIVVNRVENVDQLMQQEFSGYFYNDKLSSPDNLVFTRDAA